MHPLIRSLSRGLSGFVRSLPDRLFGPEPFARLAHTHALSTGSDAFIAVSLAGSLFFNVSVGAAQSSVALYLALTMAPFAVVAPFVGPLVDRFSTARTSVIALTLLVRGILCLFLASDLQSLLFYPEAFAVLVLGKAYSVAKSAAVPGLVEDHDQLVAANARLSRLSAIGGGVGGLVALAIINLGTAPAVLRVGALVFFTGAGWAMTIPRVQESATASPREEREEAHFPSIIIGASVVTVLRASLGFMGFLIAFGFRRAGEPSWLYLAPVAAVGIGNFAATLVIPWLRRHWLREEQLFSFALAVTGVVALLAAIQIHVVTVTVVGLVVGFGANLGKQAFDSVLQRDAPDVVRGRYFARSETRFQLAWVVGALVPVVFNLPFRVGLLILGAALMLGLGACLAGVSWEDRLVRRVRRMQWVQRRVGGGAAKVDVAAEAESAGSTGAESADAAVSETDVETDAADR